jgi:hypothetical protein
MKMEYLLIWTHHITLLSVSLGIASVGLTAVDETKEGNQHDNFDENDDDILMWWYAM